MKYKAHLLVNKTGDTAGDITTWHGGGKSLVDLSGTIDGATATIYLDVANGYNTNIVELAMTELGVYELNGIPNDASIKCVVSGSGASTDLTCVMVDVE